MKKNSLLKIFGIMFLAVVVLSWIIPAGSGATEPIGIVNLFRMPVVTIQTFIQYFIAFVAIGAFYGVLNKTGCYSKIIDKVSKSWKKSPKLFLILTAVFFVVVSSLSGSSMFIFALVPLFAAILMTLGYSNITALTVTVGGLLVGQIASVYGFNIVGYYVNVLSLKINSYILARLIMFVVAVGLFIFMISKIKLDNTSKKDDKKSKTKKVVKEAEVVNSTKNIPLLTNNTTKKSLVPFIIIICLLLLVSFVGLYNWYYSFGIQFFDNLDAKLQAIAIGDYPIVANLLSGSTSLGYWGSYEFVIALFIGSVILAWIYDLKFNDYIDGLVEGGKQMLSPAIYATLANIVFSCMLLGQNGSMADTIIGYIANMSKSFNILSTSLISLVGGIFYNDYYYAINSANAVFANYASNTMGLAGFLSGAIYGVLMLVLPTSVYLVAGLKLFDVSYKDWFKNIWKYALIIFIAIIFLVSCLFLLK